MELLKFIFSGFWIFIGFLLLFSACLKFILIMWNRFLRFWTLRKYGYPPIHCDADGDFKVEKSEE